MKIKLATSLLLLFCFALCLPLSGGEPDAPPVKKIWDAGGHNAFTDLIRFGEYFYCAFREGTGHIPGKKTGEGDGTVRIIRSKEGKEWESVALLQKPAFDLRDSKLSITPDGRIMVTMGGSVYVDQVLTKRVPQVSFSDARGECFSDPADMQIDEEVRSNFDWLWRVTWRKAEGDRPAVGYGVLYQFDTLEAPDWRLWLMKTADGIHFEKAAPLAVDCRPNEATVLFAPDGTMTILVRRESGDRCAWFGRAAEPFADWTWRSTGESLGGPNFIYLPDGTIFAGGRVKGKTGLGEIMPDGTYRNLITLPSAGDNSYPGFCLTEDSLLISYYSSHDGKTSIWLTKLSLDEIAALKKGKTINLALGKKYTLDPKPAYPHCTDDGDAVQLTDGETTTEYFWTQKGCVGWNGVKSAEITLDLEKIEPIEGVAFNSAAGVAGVDWPSVALCLVSDDGETWYSAGDLMTLDLQQNGAREIAKYNLRKIGATGLCAKGRFVKLFLLPSSDFIFLDEIEVTRGDDVLLTAERTEEPVASIAQATEKIRFDARIRQRYYRDRAALTKLVEEKIASLDAASGDSASADSASIEQKAAFAALLEEIAAVKPDEGALDRHDPKTFRTIFPYDETHAQIFALQAKYWRLCGARNVAVRKISFWDFAVPFENIPPKEEGPASIVMAQNEHRGTAFTLYSTQETPVTVTLRLDGFPYGAEQNVTVSDIPWTDTASGIPVAAALVPAQSKDGVSWQITLCPGLPKQVWLSVDSAAIPPGDYSGVLKFDAADVPIPDQPLALSVRPVLIPEKKRLLLGGWDYTDDGGRYNVNRTNLTPFVALLKRYDVNAPWADPPVMLSRVKIEGGAETPVTVTLDTTLMDEWLALWPDAKEYYIFLSVPTKFGPFTLGAPDFDEAVERWSKAWGDYFTAKKIDPSRVSLLVRDEPGLAHELDLTPLIAWSQAIKKGEPRFKIWEDPVYTPPTEMPSELVGVCDTLCPNRPQWLQNREGFESVYRKAQAEGTELQFYSCSGPVRLLDPYNYFRLQAWHAFAEGATASFFWALGDGSGQSSWNEYLLAGNGFTPLFIDPNDPVVIPAKQLEAMRESVQDYELLMMLRQQVEEKKASEKATEAEKDAIRAAEQLLTEGVASVLWAEGNDQISWVIPKDRSRADALRLQILNALTK